MGSNMGMEFNTSQMAIYIKVNTLMDWQKDLENLYGLMEQNTREISSKGTETGMESGHPQKKEKNIKVIIFWIENMGMGFTLKPMAGSTKETISRILALAMECFLRMDNSSIVVSGKMIKSFSTFKVPQRPKSPLRAQ